MTTDAWLAIAHHLAVFGLLAVLAMEWAMVRPGMGAVEVHRLTRIDASYGVLAAAVLVAGIARVALGAKPADFYLENPVFWAKMASFAAVGLLSIRPTIRYLGWRTAPPADDEVAAARRFISIELAAFAAIPIFAALMARGIGG
jgi:putative membrane protein